MSKKKKKKWYSLPLNSPYQLNKHSFGDRNIHPPDLDVLRPAIISVHVIKTSAFLLITHSNRSVLWTQSNRGKVKLYHKLLLLLRLHMFNSCKCSPDVYKVDYIQTTTVYSYHVYTYSSTNSLILFVCLRRFLGCFMVRREESMQLYVTKF